MRYKEQKKAVRKIIVELGLKTQVEFAEALGVSPQKVRHWSAGNTKIPNWVFKFAECLKKQIDTPPHK